MPNPIRPISDRVEGTLRTIIILSGGILWIASAKIPRMPWTHNQQGVK